jgi:hypothetical protein
MTALSRSWTGTLVFWLPFAAVYIAGSLGLGWLIGSPFGRTQWALGTATILAGQRANGRGARSSDG